MVATLPADVLVLICEELGNRLDFRSLFNCALSGKSFASPAISWLYRIHNQSEYFRNDETDTELPGTQTMTWEDGVAFQKRFASKWALLWKSIIRSSLGNTAYPYCLYIRSLDLRNLASLLEDSHFREPILDTFFAGDMTVFYKSQDTPVKKKTRSTKTRLNVAPILDLVGEYITSYVSDAADRNKAIVALEEISGDISTTALSRWASRLSRLKTITLYDGSVLNEDVATVINKHCPNFDDLTFCFCLRDNVDSDIASFFSALRSNSLQSFTALSAQSIGPQTFSALNNHSRSLKALKLDDLKPDAIRSLSLLKGCEALEALDLQDADGFINLEATENDIFLEILAWLGRCERLKEFCLKKFLSAPAILTDLCLRNNIRLRRLELVEYSLVNNQRFHQAMSHQTSLESLILRADAEGAFRDDIDTLVSCISQLTNLTELDLCETSDYFRSPEISRLASSLPNLEKFSFSGYDVTDAIWPSISGLRHLRALNAHAVTSFTYDGLLDYISTLQPTNQGLVLSVMSQRLDYDLSDRQKATIQERIVAKMDGRFEFVLFRETDSDFDSGSD